MTTRTAHRQPDVPRIRIGISSCLLGDSVRFDGGHKRNRLLIDTLGPFVDWVPVCPEVEAGFGTPREAMRLERVGGSIRLITTRTGEDVTARLADTASQRVRVLAREDLSGYILKKDSPSCGLERVKVYEAGGSPALTGRGLFAARLLEQLPSLPVEEEGRLSDPRVLEHFVERAFAYRRLRALFAGRWTAGALARFHTAHELVLMSHSPAAHRRLGWHVGAAKRRPRADLARQYTDGFMAALRVVATPTRHASVLRHMAGRLKAVLDADARRELLATIDDYRRERVPLIVPIALLRRHVRRHAVADLAGQVYLDPYPTELTVRHRT